MVCMMMCWLLMLVILMMVGCVLYLDSVCGCFELCVVKVDGCIVYYQVFILVIVVCMFGVLLVVLFLYGFGECGGDGVKQIYVGLGLYLCRYVVDFFVLVVFLQVLGCQEWSGCNNCVVLVVLDVIIVEFGVDFLWQYLIGMLMGGYGSWNIVLDDFGCFVVIVLVCGVVLVLCVVCLMLFVEQVVQEFDLYVVIVKWFWYILIWIFYGVLDDVVLLDDDCWLYVVFQNVNVCDVCYIEYLEGNYNVWDVIYVDFVMWVWLFVQK